MVGYLAIIKVIGLAVEDQTDVVDGRLLTTENVAWEMVVPLGAAFVFVYAVITALGWWRTVFDDPRPVQRWVVAVPLIFIVVIVAGIDYGGLADRGIGFTLTLLGACLLVGFGEEGMFRAIGVTSLRQHGLTETRVALWSSLLFGAVHLTQPDRRQRRRIGQAIVVSFAGYFFYLIRRVTRSNILNSLLHGGFDFMILSGTAIIRAARTPTLAPCWRSLPISCAVCCSSCAVTASSRPTHPVTSTRTARRPPGRNVAAASRRSLTPAHAISFW